MNRRKLQKYLMPGSSKMSLEDRLLYSSIVASLFIAIVANILGTILSLPLYLRLTGYSAFIVIIIMYYHLRKGKVHPAIKGGFVLISFLVNVGGWFFGGGLDSQNVVITATLLILSLIIVPARWRSTILASYIILVIAGYFFQMYRPELITPYHSVHERWVDGLTTTIYSIVFLFLIVQFLLKNYAFEKRKADLSQLKLRNLNKTLESRIQERTREIEFKNHVLRMAGKTAFFGVWSFETSNRSLYWSPEVCNIHSVPDNYIPEVPRDLDFFTDDFKEKVRVVFTECASLGTPFDEIVQIKTRDGNLIWIRFTGEAERDPGGKIIRTIGSFQNIDTLKKTEKELMDAKLEAEIANSAKSRFLLNISHEFRTPLNSVIGYADLLENSDGKNIPMYTGPIKASGRRLLDMVDNILELIRTEKTDIEIENDWFETAKFFKEFKNTFTEAIAEKKLLFRTTLEKGLPEKIFSDIRHLRMAVSNLIDNAIKFTDKGEINLKVYLKPASRSGSIGGYDLNIEIQDTGKGIPEENQKLLFESFSQPERKTISNGLGIGLSLSNRIISRLNGSIKVTSQPGMGSIFIITLHNIEYKDISSSIGFQGENVPDGIIKHKVNLADITDIEGLIRELEGDLILTCMSFETRQPVNEVKKFGLDLKELGEKHNCQLITDYGQQLIESANNFDIAAMLRLISIYTDKITALKA